MPADKNHDKCQECPFLAIRQNTLITDGPHRVAGPLALCFFVTPVDLLVLPAQFNPSTSSSWNDLIRIPTALFELHTCLLR
jgi:hypothetical protein